VPYWTASTAPHERVIATKNGEPSVAVMAVEDLESLQETLAILRDDQTMSDLARAEVEADGRAISAPVTYRLVLARSAAPRARGIENPHREQAAAALAGRDHPARTVIG